MANDPSSFSLLLNPEVPGIPRPARNCRMALSHGGKPGRYRRMILIRSQMKRGSSGTDVRDHPDAKA